jgi:V8-like Glu-specific endopeptidase
MPPILQTFPYPFDQPAAQELHVTLTRLYPTPDGVRVVAERAGVDMSMVYLQQAPLFLWHDVLVQAAAGGLTEPLVREARDLQSPNSPARPFLDELLAGGTPPVDGEPRNADGSAAFLKDDDTVSEPEALLFKDDLTLQIGRVPGLIATLQRLIELAPAVCRLVVDVHGLAGHGSGFRIGPDLLLTNWHVLHNRHTGARATAVTAEFGYEDDAHGAALAPTLIPCDVASIVTDQADDWAVIRAQQPLDGAWPVIKLSEAVEPVAHEPAYIVQHPGGNRKRVGYVRNSVSSFDDRVLHYLTDTQQGSSGSPVFDAAGGLIGLHHAGGTPQQVTGSPPVAKNEGIRIPRVVAGLAAQGVATP